MNINNRLRQFIKYKKMSFGEFGKKTDMSESNVRLSNNYGSNQLNKIIKAFPELNILWLITGEGNMINDLHDQQNNAELISEPPAMYNKNTLELIDCQKKIIELQNEIRRLEKKIFELKLEKNVLYNNPKLKTK